MDALKTSCFCAAILFLWASADIDKRSIALLLGSQGFDRLLIEVTSLQAFVLELAQIILDGFTTHHLAICIFSLFGLAKDWTFVYFYGLDVV
jgi:hypothetical protein